MRRRSAGFWLLMTMILLAAGTSSLTAQASEQAPVETEETEEAAVPAVEDGAAAQATDWQHELDLIADLLIDGKSLEAKERAERLLEEEGLPENVSSRTRTLRDRAVAKLAEPPAKPEPRPKIEIPAKSPAGEDTGKTETPEAAQEQSFRVRVALIGRGFGEGSTGLLRVSETGLSFLQQGKSKQDWAIRWKDLAEARKDEGLWDAPYPLVLIERGGRKHFIAHVDQKGHYLPGQAVLSAISKSRGLKDVGEKPASPPESR